MTILTSGAIHHLASSRVFTAINACQGSSGVLQLAQKRATCIFAIPQHGQITTATFRSLVTIAVILLVGCFSR